MEFINNLATSGMSIENITLENIGTDTITTIIIVGVFLTALSLWHFGFEATFKAILATGIFTIIMVIGVVIGSGFDGLPDVIISLYVLLILPTFA